MRRNIVLTGLLFYVLTLYGQNFNETEKSQSFILNAQEITELNAPLIAAINRHIKVSKVKKIKNKGDFFIFIRIYPTINTYDVPRKIIDSIYSFNNFQKTIPEDSISHNYSLSIELLSKKFLTGGWAGVTTYKNIFYYNYNGYDVLLASDLEIIFMNDLKTRQFDLILLANFYPKKKKTYNIRTIYNMRPPYISEVRYKDLIWPNWTSNRSDFK
jgi:hypothetical protein